VRILKAWGYAATTNDRRRCPAFRRVQAKNVRVIDEWLPVKDWPTAAVRKCHAGAVLLDL
jgi:hypothetical protein